MTYPLIGNYGVCLEDMESERIWPDAVIVRELARVPSNFRCDMSLQEFLEKYETPGIEGIDTRKLARHIRDYGSCKAVIVSCDEDTESALKKLKETDLDRDVVSKVSTTKAYNAGMIDGKESRHIVAIDCGMKRNILREMSARGCRITVVPFNTSAEDILALSPDGLFVSNGPGDPEDVKDTINTVKNLIGKLPIFGICLGHQIISLAYGAKTYKLKFGHRGGNHPVKNLKTDKIEITSQNHSYSVDTDSLKGTGLEVTHINILDNTVEGMECIKDKVFSVQYHPESAPGPQDSSYLFDVFLNLIDESRQSVKEEKNA